MLIPESLQWVAHCSRPTIAFILTYLPTQVILLRARSYIGTWLRSTDYILESHLHLLVFSFFRDDAGKQEKQQHWNIGTDVDDMLRI